MNLGTWQGPRTMLLVCNHKSALHFTGAEWNTNLAVAHRLDRNSSTLAPRKDFIFLCCWCTDYGRSDLPSRVLSTCALCTWHWMMKELYALNLHKHFPLLNIDRRVDTAKFKISRTTVIMFGVFPCAEPISCCPRQNTTMIGLPVTQGFFWECFHVCWNPRFAESVLKITNNVEQGGGLLGVGRSTPLFLDPVDNGLRRVNWTFTPVWVRFHSMTSCIVSLFAHDKSQQITYGDIPPDDLLFSGCIGYQPNTLTQLRRYSRSLNYQPIEPTSPRLPWTLLRDFVGNLSVSDFCYINSQDMSPSVHVFLVRVEM